MTDRKPWAPDLPFTSAAFSSNGRLPTEEQTREAMEKSFRDVIREDLHRDALPAGVPTPTEPSKFHNKTGWQNEVPISAPEGIALIDRIVNAHAPQPTPRVEIAELRKIDAGAIREKLDWAVAAGKLTRAKADQALCDLGIGPEDQPELVDA